MLRQYWHPRYCLTSKYSKHACTKQSSDVENQPDDILEFPGDLLCEDGGLAHRTVVFQILRQQGVLRPAQKKPLCYLFSYDKKLGKSRINQRRI
jgi:hypothetical protein